MRAKPNNRRGSVLPLFAVSLVMLVGFVALSIDLGVMAVAKTQCQNAADAAALAGARTLNGSTTGNTTQATTNAQAVAVANTVLSNTLQTSAVAVQHGSYHYNSGSQTFTPQIPPVAPDNYNLTQATVTFSNATSFAKIFNMASFNITATAVAANRPRDVAIVLDFSGSMNNETDLWNCESYLGSMLNTPNNTDPVFPQWGWYAPSYSANATLQCTSTNPLVGECNITTAVQGVPALVNDFYSNSRGASAASAFAAAPAAVTNTAPGGDVPLTVKSSSAPALTWLDVVGTTSTQYTGYANFKGYTQGPGYWGKTFFAWPPDPNVANDWRKKFFFLSDGATPVNDNRALYDGNGNWLNPTGNYVINYKAILAWIASSPNPFPTQLRAGNVLYYSSIPADVPSSAYDHTQPNSNITNSDQRFWKEYIDFVVGVWMDPFGNIQNPGTSTCSYGPDFQAGTGTIQITGPDKDQPGPTGLFMDKADNPLRPRHRFWFGPATMIQYMLDAGTVPGTVHDVSMVPAKLGIAGALQDIQNNHPNDLVSICVFARPTFTGETGVGKFDSPLNNLGRSYTSMINSLWYPPNSGSADVRPWDTNGNLTPCAHGDYCSNTATSYGLMLAYNQYSSNSALVATGMGGNGRVGAAKLVILETDGMANVSTSCGSTNSGANNSFYNIGPSYTYSNGSADPATDAINVATQICAPTSGGGGSMPGYATTQKPVSIQCIAFGAIFEPTASGSAASQAVSMLQSISTIGGSTFPSSASDPTNGYKWCIGTLSQRQSLLQQAFTTIMDGNSINVILVK